MKKLIAVVLILISGHIPLFAQDAKLDKKIKKAETYMADGKYEKAEEKLKKLTEANPQYGKAWDALTKSILLRYEQQKRKPALSYTITTTNKAGEELENDSLTNVLADLLNGAMSGKLTLNRAKYTMRKALANCNDAYMTSIYLRNYMIDTPKDTAVDDKARSFYEEAEVEFQKKNYAEAAKLYQKALEIEPQYYQASLYLGDAYYYMEYFMQAAQKFEEAIEKFPNELEPRKYLVDALMEEGLYEKALEEAIKAVEVYPDLIVMVKLRNAAYASGKKINVKWTPRPVLPNSLSAKTGYMASSADEAIYGKAPWGFYEDALAKVKDDCNELGIIEQSSKTDERYLEVFSWVEMLKNSDAPELDEAREMQKRGFLDCYVLVTCFHYDFYDQYIDFVKANPGKVKSYFTILMERN